MRLDDLEPTRAMVIHAHPDDAEFGVAGTVATWTRAGVEVTYCVVTDGAAGCNDLGRTRTEVAASRKAEQHEAAQILGVGHVTALGLPDGYVEPDVELRRALVREIRTWRPDVIVVGNPTSRFIGGSRVNHPDHVAVGEAALRAMNPDASSHLMFPELWKDEGLAPHQPSALLLLELEEAPFHIDITDVIDVKLRALMAHRSQTAHWPAADLVRQRNEDAGRQIGCKYAEGFRVLQAG